MTVSNAVVHTADTDKTRQDCLVLSCPCRRYELNWRQDKTVFSSPQYIWDLTVANWKLRWDKTKLSSHRISRQDKTVLSCRQFSLHRRHEQDKTVFVLSVSAVWNRHITFSCQFWRECVTEALAWSESVIKPRYRVIHYDKLHTFALCSRELPI